MELGENFVSPLTDRLETERVHRNSILLMERLLETLHAQPFLLQKGEGLLLMFPKDSIEDSELAFSYVLGLLRDHPVGHTLQQEAEMELRLSHDRHS